MASFLTYLYLVVSEQTNGASYRISHRSARYLLCLLTAREVIEVYSCAIEAGVHSQLEVYTFTIGFYICVFAWVLLVRILWDVRRDDWMCSDDANNEDDCGSIGNIIHLHNNVDFMKLMIRSGAILLLL
jgi:hypothetical protein